VASPETLVKIEQVRDHVGSEPDDLAVEDALTRQEDDVLRAALSILLRRRADLISSPGKLSVDQDYSRETTKVQLDALNERIAEVLRLIDLEDGVEGDEDASALPAVSVARLDPDEVSALDAEWPVSERALSSGWW
jgi:hypothetical protein